LEKLEPLQAEVFIGRSCRHGLSVRSGEVCSVHQVNQPLLPINSGVEWIARRYGLSAFFYNPIPLMLETTSIER
jgi:hypothetical protein